MAEQYEYYRGNERLPAEIVERDKLISKGMKLPYQAKLEMLMPNGSVACITLRASCKEDFMATMEVIADTALYPKESKDA